MPKTNVMTKPLLTIGYEGLDIDRFVVALLSAGVEAIADVRAVPISRKRGFSKRRLAERLWSEGLDYEHFQALGDPKAGREAARSGRFGDFERIYAAHLATVPAQAALADLARYAYRQTTCLLCFEQDPTFCHRSRVASALSGSGFVVRHLVAEKSNVRVSSVGASRHSGESTTPT